MDNRMKVQEEISNIKSGMVGFRYRHFKGRIYIVTDIAVHSETEEPMVVYKSFRNGLGGDSGGERKTCERKEIWNQ